MRYEGHRGAPDCAARLDVLAMLRAYVVPKVSRDDVATDAHLPAIFIEAFDMAGEKRRQSFPWTQIYGLIPLSVH